MALIPTIGRSVLITMKDGTDRPFIVTSIFPQADPTAPMLNGHLLLDGGNDRDNNPFAAPMELTQRADQEEGDDEPKTPAPLTHWATSVPFDAAKNVGTWHWPERV